jgi:hypothetical protein
MKTVILLAVFCLAFNACSLLSGTTESTTCPDCNCPAVTIPECPKIPDCNCPSIPDTVFTVPYYYSDSLNNIYTNNKFDVILQQNLWILSEQNKTQVLLDTLIHKLNTQKQ